MAVEESEVRAVVVNFGAGGVERGVGVNAGGIGDVVVVEIEVETVAIFDGGIDVMGKGVHVSHGVGGFGNLGEANGRIDVRIIECAAERFAYEAEVRADPAIPAGGVGGFGEKTAFAEAAGAAANVIGEDGGVAEIGLVVGFFGEVGSEFGVPEGLGVIGVEIAEGREDVVEIVDVKLGGGGPVFHVGGAGDGFGFGAGFGNGGEKKSGEDGDDRERDEEFDEREGSRMARCGF